MADARKLLILWDGHRSTIAALMYRYSPEGERWPWLASTQYYSTADT